MKQPFFLMFLLVIVVLTLTSCGKQTLKAPQRPTPQPAVDTMNNLANGDPNQGKALFHGETPNPPAGFVACTTCHYTAAEQGILVGPNMSGVANRANTRIANMPAETYLRDSILEHDAFIVTGFEAGVMINIVGDDFANILSPEDIDHLVAYLMTLDGPESLDQLVAEGRSAQHAGIATSNTSTLTDAGLVILGKPAQECTVNDSGIIITNNKRFTFQPPTDWHTLSFSGTIATHPQDANRNYGPVIAMMEGALPDLNIPNEHTTKITSTATFFSLMMENLRNEIFDVTISDEQDSAIGGYPAHLATITGYGFGDIDESFAGRVAIALLAQDRVFVMIGIATPTEQWQHTAIFNEMLASITFDDRMQTSQTSTTLHQDRQHFADNAMHTQQKTQNMVLAIMAKQHIGGNGYPMPLAELDRDQGPRFACVQCHVTHDVTMLHDSNPSCNSCHRGTPYQRHCVDCHSIHDVKIPHEPDNPGCASCHAAGIPGKGVDVQHTLVTFLSYLFHEV